MSENFLWSTYGVADAGDDWDMARHPVLQRPDHGRVQRRHVPDPQGQQAPRRGVQGPDLPPRRGAQDLLTTYGGMPARSSRAGRLLRRASRATTVHRRRSTGRSPTTASRSPTSRTSSRTCPPTTRPSTCSTRSARSGRPPGPRPGRRDRRDLKTADPGRSGTRAAADRA